MTTRPFSTKAALSYGWAKTIDHLNLFIPLCLIGWVLSALQAGINRWHGAATLMRWLIAPVLFLATVQMSIVWVRTILRVQDDRAPTTTELTHVDLAELFQYMLGSLLYGLVVACGMVLLVVPGVLWAINPDTGQQVWGNKVGRGSANGGVHWGMAYDGQRIFVPNNDSNRPASPTENPAWGPGISAVNAMTGEIEWSYNNNARDCGQDFPVAKARKPAPEWRMQAVTAPIDRKSVV